MRDPQKKPQLSVIICTHNPRPDYFQRLLAALRQQSLHNTCWELLVVDNASHEPLAQRYDLSWHPHARHIREDELGLAVARQRGMREASAELLVFADDDNVLEPNYLRQAQKISRDWPLLGVWGGSIVPEFEVAPLPHLREHLSVLALREIRSPRWSNVMTCSDAEPWGPGLCVRSAVAHAYRRQYWSSPIQLTGRSGRNLLSGEDTEIAFVACGMGFGMGVFPELKVTHLIPAARVDDAYMLRAVEGIITSSHLLAFKWQGIVPKSPVRGLDLARMVINFLLRGGFERRRYVAQVRAALRARSIIAASTGPSEHGARAARTRIT